MAVDTPAKIAILGAGPIGLEAALYARFLGYEVEIFEQGTVAANVSKWRHVKMFTPFSMNSTKLGREAIIAQNDAVFPDDDALLTGSQFVDQYLRPLSETDLIAGSVREHSRVVAIGKQTLGKSQAIGSSLRADEKFRIQIKKASAEEEFSEADIVIDCTGTFSNPRRLGPGGIPAIGENGLRSEIEYGIPDVLGADRDSYGGKQILVVGAGFSAATTVVALSNLQSEQPATQLTWLVRSDSQHPIPVIENDQLAERSRLANEANRLASSDSIQFR